MTRTVLVGKPVCRPHAAGSVLAVHRVDKAKTLGLVGIGSRVRRVTQQPGRHAGPRGEDDKGNQIAHGHGPPALLVEIRRQLPHLGTPSSRRHALGADAVQAGTGPGGGDVEEDGEEQDAAGNVDEGVDAVGPVHECRVRHEPLLDGTLDKDAQTLLEVDELQRVPSCNVDGSLVNQDDCAEGSCELVDLVITARATHQCQPSGPDVPTLKNKHALEGRRIDVAYIPSI